MTRETISAALAGIDDRHIIEAAAHAPSAAANPHSLPRRAAIAAVLALCLLLGGVLASPSPTTVSAHFYPTQEPLTPTGAMLDTGTISNTGEQTGHPLMFYLSGKDIETVRFSCKNQTLTFLDWTEQRETYSAAQNFTVRYGADAEEYYYLTIDWVPTALQRALTDREETTIATLPPELREDMIVLEITFADGSTATKAITVTLRDNGTFFAAFDDYTITAADDFVRRSDAQPDGTEYSASIAPDIAADTETDESPLSEEALTHARDAAAAYYVPTVFTVEELTLLAQSADTATFSVLVSRGGIVQEPARTITLTCTDGAWTVVNEGY